MGILNLTPDSFYDGGKYLDPNAAQDQAMAMIAAGADILDIGAESSRPGATPISAGEEIDRILPVMEKIIAQDPTAISIDTYKPEVMQATVDAGAACINDIFALRQEGALRVAAKLDVPICLMHIQGSPKTMQNNPEYAQGVMHTVNDFFAERIAACEKAGIARSRLILDPGFGFGKTVQHNLQMMNQVEQFHQHQLPILLGVSRKSTIGKIIDQPPEGRLAGGLALAVYAMLSGVAMIRTHDVLETQHAFKVIQEMQLSTERKG